MLNCKCKLCYEDIQICDTVRNYLIEARVWDIEGACEMYSRCFALTAFKLNSLGPIRSGKFACPGPMVRKKWVPHSPGKEGGDYCGRRLNTPNLDGSICTTCSNEYSAKSIIGKIFVKIPFSTLPAVPCARSQERVKVVQDVAGVLMEDTLVLWERHRHTCVFVK